MRKNTKALVSALLIGALTAAPGTSASADERSSYDPPETNSDGWIVYSDVTLRSAEVYTVQGQADEEGTCHFQDEATLTPGETSVTIREMAFNPATCQSKVALSGAPSDAGAPLDTEAEATLEGKESDDGVRAQAAVRSAGYLWSWYEDPINIKVAEVSNSTEWSWNGSRVLSSPVPMGGQGTRHYTPTGWVRESRLWNNVYNSTQTTSSTLARFRNSYFCTGAFTTYVYADENTVHGQADGTLRGVWDWSKDGGCNALLSFNHQLTRTQN